MAPGLPTGWPTGATSRRQLRSTRHANRAPSQLQTRVGGARPTGELRESDVALPEAARPLAGGAVGPSGVAKRAAQTGAPNRKRRVTPEDVLKSAPGPRDKGGPGSDAPHGVGGAGGEDPSDGDTPNSGGED